MAKWIFFWRFTMRGTEKKQGSAMPVIVIINPSRDKGSIDLLKSFREDGYRVEMTRLH